MSSSPLPPEMACSLGANRRGEEGDRPILIIFDLNGVLIHHERYAPNTSHLSNNLNVKFGGKRRHWERDEEAVTEWSPPPNCPRSVGRVGGRRVWIRPHAEAFLRRLLHAGYHVALWSTAREDTLRALLHVAIPADVLPRLAFAWDRRWCTSIKGELLKDLSTVWRHPSLCGAYGPDNTIIVDDSPRKIRRNPAPNTHCMPTFHPGADDADIELMPRCDLWNRVAAMRGGRGAGEQEGESERQKNETPETPEKSTRPGVIARPRLLSLSSHPPSHPPSYPSSSEAQLQAAVRAGERQ